MAFVQPGIEGLQVSQGGFNSALVLHDPFAEGSRDSKAHIRSLVADLLSVPVLWERTTRVDTLLGVGQVR